MDHGLWKCDECATVVAVEGYGEPGYDDGATKECPACGVTPIWRKVGRIDR